MAKPEALLKELRQKARSNGEKSGQLSVSLGRLVGGLDPKLAEDPALETLIDESISIQSEIQRCTTAIQLWRQSEEKLDKAKIELRDIDQEIVRKRNEIEPLFEQIGLAAVSSFSEETTNLESLQELFGSLRALEDNIKTKERELRQIESSAAPDSLVGKTISRGRGLVIRGGLKSRESQRIKGLKKLGEQIIQIDELVKSQDPSSLTEVIGPIRDQISELNKLKSRRGKTLTKQAEIEKSQTEMEKNEGMRNPIRNLEHRLNRLESDELEVSRKIGFHVHTQKTSFGSEASAVQELLDQLMQIDEDNQRFDKFEKRIMAALEAERLRAEIEVKKKRAGKITKELTSIENEIAQLVRELEAQERLRGSLKSLKLEEE